MKPVRMSAELLLKEHYFRVSEKARWVKALGGKRHSVPARSDDLNLNPRTYMAEEN